jgi:predicted small metal-binding protein
MANRSYKFGGKAGAGHYREWDKFSRANAILVMREADLGRMFVDCRDYPSEMNCTVAISADTQKELLEAAVQHAVAVHGHQDSPQLRHELAKMIKA